MVIFSNFIPQERYEKRLGSIERFKDKPITIFNDRVATPSVGDKEIIQRKIDDIRDSVDGDTLPSVYLLHGEFTDEEMNEIYNHPKIKAMVSFTKGEGFGRPLLEFSLTNKPIITTGWSGHTDFLNSEFTSLMGGQLTDIHPSAQVKDMLIESSKWFSVDHGQIGHYLNDVFNNYKESVFVGDFLNGFIYEFKLNEIFKAKYNKKKDKTDKCWKNKCWI